MDAILLSDKVTEGIYVLSGHASCDRGHSRRVGM